MCAHWSGFGPVCVLCRQTLRKRDSFGEKLRKKLKLGRIDDKWL